MSSAKCIPLTVFSLLVLICCAVPFSTAQGQRPGNLGITAQANLSGTPMLGIDYAVSDQSSVRFTLGYYQHNDRVSPCSGVDLPPDTFCELVLYEATTHQFSSSLAGVAQMVSGSNASAHTGVEVQHLYAWAPERGQYNAGFSNAQLAGHRIAVSALAGLSIQLESWLSLFGEIGVGHMRGLPVRAFRADLDSSVNRWGITHVAPGLRVSL